MPTLPTRSVLAVRVLVWAIVVRWWLRRLPLSSIVQRLAVVDRRRTQRINAGVLGRGVRRLLSVGPLRARCLVMALVHYRLLREQGDRPELVIGLQDRPLTSDAHAWVEIDGIDVGPPPGRGVHRELLRYA
jgi:hypothetical protein